MSAPIKILSIGDMDPKVDAALAERFDVVRDETPGFEAVTDSNAATFRALITRGAVATTAALMARLPKLELIANFNVGYDSVDVAAAARRGIIVTNTPDVLNGEMGDFTIGLLLATIRRIPQAERHLRTGNWAAGESFPLGPSLRGRHIGIIGMARAVDTLIVVVPGGPSTRHLIDAEVLAALGPNGVLINVARGSVVDEDALIAALRDGAILAAGLDVFAREPHVPEALLHMDQVVLLPHIGTSTFHTRGLMGQLVVDNVTSWFDGKGALTPVAETPQGRG
jgi:lactate dehydrogenase-like 2-hydroxyacid dehydrogenase